VTDARPVVLVVDDDPDILRLVGKALSLIDVEVIARDRSFGVLNTIAEHRPALVLLDVTMPGLDGASIAQLVRADPELTGTIILLYSALPPDRLEQIARTSGADGFIPKTDGPRKLCTEVARRLGL